MNKIFHVLAIVLLGGCSSFQYAFVGDNAGEDAAFDYLRTDAVSSLEIEVDSFDGDANKIALDKHDANIKYNNLIATLDYLQNDVNGSYRSGVLRGINNYFIDPICFGVDAITLDLFNVYDEKEAKTKERSWKFVYETNAQWYDVKYEYFKYGNVINADGHLVETAVARRDDTLIKINERRSVVLDLVTSLSRSTHSINIDGLSLYKEQANNGNDLVNIIKEYTKDFAKENVSR